MSASAPGAAIAWMVLTGLERRLRQQLQRLDRLLLQIPKPSLDIRRARFRLFDALGARGEERPLPHELDDAKALGGLAARCDDRRQARSRSAARWRSCPSVQIDGGRLNDLGIAAA